MTSEILPGETGQQYIRRMHGGKCNCPTAYARCRWAVHYDHLNNDRSRGHGGWGWPTRYIPYSEISTFLDLGDHIEMDHERELPPLMNMQQIRTIHDQMHRERSDWGHTHV